MSHLQHAFRSINDTFARAQSRYDRQLPRDEPEAVAVDPMDQLRDDLSKKLDAQDIACAIWDHLNETDADIEMIRKAAFGDPAAAMEIFKAAIKKVALDRAA
jgi:hypothetical protein